jgi:Protein of unknown function (DUF2934)
MANRVGTAKRVSGQGSVGAVEAEGRGDVPREELRPAAEESPQKSTIEDEIRLRAYYRYLERENESGDEMSDWLEAESDVLSRHATGVDAEEKVRDDTGLQTQERD